MSTTINTGWLKDSQGNKFAPKTILSQVVNNDGVSLQATLDAMAEKTNNRTQVQIITWEDND